jgi:hypothetical protein
MSSALANLGVETCVEAAVAAVQRRLELATAPRLPLLVASLLMGYLSFAS